MHPILEFRIYEDLSGAWRWRAVDSNGKIVADSAEAYVSEAGAVDALENIFGHFDAQAVRILFPNGEEYHGGD